MELLKAWLVVLSPFAGLGLAMVAGKLLFPVDKNVLKKIMEEERKKRLSPSLSESAEEIRRKIKSLKTIPRV